MYERFTERSNRAMFDSRHNAFLDGSHLIEGRHLLYALVASQDGLVLAALRRGGVSADLLLSALPAVPRAPSGRPDREIPFSDEMKRVLNFAVEEADALNHKRIWTAHLLLGLLRDELSAGRGPLKDAGLTLDPIRAIVRESV
jgi:ATP-dependent Clp protease ATP-binding subunit ClpC